MAFILSGRVAGAAAADARRFDYGAGVTRGQYTHQHCPICRAERNFKLLPNERDEYQRTLMVCTRCNGKRPKPGQTKVDWRDLLGH